MANRRARNTNRIAALVFIYAMITLLVAGVVFFIFKKCSSEKENYREMGIAAMEKGSYEEALGLFRSSLAEEQWFSGDMDLDTKMYIGACYLRTKRYGDAAEMYRSLTKEKSSVLDQTVVASLLEIAEANQLALSMSDGNATPPTDETVERLEKLSAEDSRMFVYLASAYNRRGEYDKSREVLQKYCQENSLNSYVAYELSSAYMREDNLAAAKNIVELGLQAKDGVYKDLLQYNQVILLESEMKYDEAYALIEQLHNQYPNNQDMLREYTFLYSRVHVDPVPVNPESDAID